MNTPEGGVRDRRRRRSSRSRRSTARSSSTTVPVSSTRDGRADQAAGEHLPPRQHRAGQRAGDRSPATSASTSGRRSTPRRQQAVRLHAVHARPRRRRALPADRPLLPVRGRCGRRSAATVPVRRAGQRHQRPHARLRRAPASERAERATAWRCNGAESCVLGLAYKKNIGDIRESPARRRGAAAARARRARCAPWSRTSRPRMMPAGRRARRADRRGARGGRRRRACSPTTTPSTTTWWSSTPRYVFDTRNRCRGPKVERL